MIRMAKVWNDGNTVYNEQYKDQMISIPPKGHVQMIEPEAAQFLGQFTGFRRIPNGAPFNAKPLRMEIVGIESDNPQGHKCTACTQDFNSEKELNVHILANHEHQMVDEDAKKALRKRIF